MLIRMPRDVNERLQDMQQPLRLIQARLVLTSVAGPLPAAAQIYLTVQTE